MHPVRVVASSSRWGLPALVSVAVVVLSGCSTYRASPPDAAVPTMNIRMHFETPRTMSIVSSSGDTLTVANVVELEGEVLERVADTLTVDVSRVKMMDPAGSSSSSRRFLEGSLVRLPSRTVEVKHFSTGRTVLLVLGLAAVLVVTVAAIAAPDFSDSDKDSGDTGKK